MAFSRTGHLQFLLLRTALVFRNFQSSGLFSLGSMLLLCVGSECCTYNNLQAVCCISSGYPWALCSPRQNIRSWDKAGIQALRMLFSCSQICCPPRMHRSEVLCILALTAILASVLTKYSCWAGALLCLSLPLCVCFSVYICLQKWKYGVEMFFQYSHSHFFPFLWNLSLPPYPVLRVCCKARWSSLLLVTF